jgi:eukaryotic-like serine/threonine-protein kinase
MPLRHAGDVLASKYRIDALLGTGGMGDVYRATNTLIGRSVAIKLLHPKHAENPDVVERFLREARVANMLRHPNVVDVIDVDRDEEGVPFIVQELLAGEDLARYVQPKGRLDIDEIDKLIVPIIDAIAFAHSQGVIHRDIKPANVFLARVRVGADLRTANETATSIKRNATATATEQIVPKLLDFGISKLQSTGGIKATDVGVVLGTPAYMAPELLTGARDANAASDVWSIGVMLFELLAGRRPFEANGPNIYVVVATTAAPRLREIAADVDADLASVVDRCLMRSTKERYTSAVDLSQDLSEALNQARLRTPEPIRRTPQQTKKADPALVVPDLDLPPTFYPVDKTRVDDARTVVDPTQMTKILNPVSVRAVVPELALPSNSTVIEPPVTTPPPISGPRATALMRRDHKPPPVSGPPLVIETPVMELAPTSAAAFAPISSPPSSPRHPHPQPQPQQQPVSSNPRIAVTGAPGAGAAAGQQSQQASAPDDMARLIGPTAIVLVSAIVMAILKGLFGRPGGFAIVRPFVDLAPQLNTAAQAGCALVCFVVAIRAFRRALVKWKSGEKPIALIFAATCGALFFATWELARAAL